MGIRHAPGFLYGQPLRSRAFPGMSLVEIAYANSLRTPEHCHERDLLCLVLDGPFVERCGRRQRTRKALEVFFHPAGESHASEFCAAGARILRIEIDPRFRPTDAGEPDGESSAHLARRLYEEFLLPDDASRLAVEEIALRLVARIPGFRTQASDRTLPAWLPDVEACLRGGYDGRLTLRDVAAAAGVHPIHLATVFRRHHGCSVGQFIRRLRIDRARRDLARSDASLSAIAADCGFADQCHFTRIFKRHVGTTPGRYRSACRSGAP
jgi:AraC family transcriptional regulator